MLRRFVRVEWWWAGAALAALHTLGDLLLGFFGQHGVSPLHPHLHLATLVVCAAAGLGSAWSRKLLILWFGWGIGVSAVLAFVDLARNSATLNPIAVPSHEMRNARA